MKIISEIFHIFILDIKSLKSGVCYTYTHLSTE